MDAIFGLPPGVHCYAILPIGWPMARTLRSTRIHRSIALRGQSGVSH
jgi:hypothetical protein